jgi:hypothetical protein
MLLVVNHAATGITPPAMGFPASKTTPKIIPKRIARIGKEEYPAMSAPL